MRVDVQPTSLAWTSASTTSAHPERQRDDAGPVDAAHRRRVARLAHGVERHRHGDRARPGRSGRRSTPSRPSRRAARRRTGPMPSARPEIPAHRPSARPRSRPWKASVRIDSEPGIRNAAPAPWAARQKMSSPIDCDSPAPIDASVNATSPARNMRLRPKTSPSRPPVTSRTREAQRVGVDRPREAGDGRAEVGLDRGQGDVHDGVVEHHHEEGEAHRPQRPPLAIGLGQNRHQRFPLVLVGGQHPQERLPHLLELPRREHRERPSRPARRTRGCARRAARPPRSGSTHTTRRSRESRSRRTCPASSSRSMTPVTVDASMWQSRPRSRAGCAPAGGSQRLEQRSPAAW